MPSPFPGMDPYLEGYLWPDVHSALAEVYEDAAHDLSINYDEPPPRPRSPQTTWHGCRICVRRGRARRNKESSTK